MDREADRLKMIADQVGDVGVIFQHYDGLLHRKLLASVRFYNGFCRSCRSLERSGHLIDLLGLSRSGITNGLERRSGVVRVVIHCTQNERHKNQGTPKS